MDDLALSTVTASKRFNSQLHRRAISEFGENGAWLLLSQVWYGWRAFFDLATGLHQGVRPSFDHGVGPAADGPEYQILVDLQVQAFLYAAAEQFATLLRAMRMHEGSTEQFFKEYTYAPPDLRVLIDDVADLERPELLTLVGDPRAAKRPPRQRRTLPHPAVTATVDVGGIAVPQETIDSQAFENLVRQADELIDLTLTNVAQLRQFVDPPPSIPGADRQPQALRSVDNSFRHGIRLLFHEAAPTTRNFRVGALLEPVADPSVDLYLPARGETGQDAITFGSVSCTIDRTLDHLEALRQLSTRVGQLARAFLGYKTRRAPDFLLAAIGLELPDPRTGPSRT